MEVGQIMEDTQKVTVNSVSGGKTSAYMAYHYPADYNVFAVVCIEDKECAPKDPALTRAAKYRLGDFIASAETDTTLKAMLDLEQMMGQKIEWVRGDSFEEVIRKRKAIPNQMMRFCTTEMKIRPIFDFCRDIADVVEMNIGFRYDEKERYERNKSNTTLDVVVGKRGTKNKWAEVEWREVQAPLVHDRVNHFDVVKWVESTDLSFPPDSNCPFCFWKPLQQIRKNWNDEPERLAWASRMEKNAKRQWKKEATYEQIKRLGLQVDFIFGTGSGCKSGFCTD